MRWSRPSASVVGQFLLQRLPPLGIPRFLGCRDGRLDPGGLRGDGVGVFCLHLGTGFGLLGVKVGLLLLGELLQEQKRCLHACAGREERLLRQADHGADKGPVFAELAHVGERGIVEDAFGQNDAEPAAGLQKGEAAFDEEDFGFDLADLIRLSCSFSVPFPLGSSKRLAMGLPLAA